MISTIRNYGKRTSPTFSSKKIRRLGRRKVTTTKEKKDSEKSDVSDKINVVMNVQ